MKNFFELGLTKKILIVSLVLPFFCLLLSGCTSKPMDYYIVSYPNKVVYQIGETVSFDGLKIKTINSDGTHRVVNLQKSDLPQVDTSTSGKKQVVVSHNGISTSFDIFVATTVATDTDDLKTIFANANDGDVVYLKAGNYMPKTDDDTSYQNIEITKPIFVVGDGADSTNIYGNFLIGATIVDNQFQKTKTQNVTIQDLRFCLDYQVTDGLMDYSGPYGSTDKNGALRIFDSKNVTIKNCTFQNYFFGVFAGTANGLAISHCTFKNIFRSAIFAQTDTQNTIIANNVIVDTAKNFVSFDGDTQSILGAIVLNFATSGVKGVSVCKNTINRTGLHRGDAIYGDQNSKERAQNKKGVFVLSYVNNTADIVLKSSAQNNLQVNGIVLSANNYGQALANIKMSTTQTDAINANGVFVTD